MKRLTGLMLAGMIVIGVAALFAPISLGNEPAPGCLYQRVGGTDTVCLCGCEDKECKPCGNIR